ncbi:LacI family DNA-binding transcriptional regulator [Alloscardovia omnicolens]|uniref:LacI family DNA-binding transcriptional regulator n=1 Tax=Alloscardovia omnicolens TaxID=419015 RepID=UPI003A7ACE44
MSANKKSRKPSMADVAQAVGVSKTTISRYLQGEYGYMSEATKTRIEEVIKELGYRPNRMAQGLKATVSHMVGVSVADIGNPFTSLLLKGIQQECRARDIQVLVSDSNNQAAVERTNIESLLDAQVDGVIVNTTGRNDEWLTSYCTKSSHKPMVMLDRIVQPIVCDCVATDNHTASFTLLDHVVDVGFDYVVFVSFPQDGISTRMMRRESVEQYFLDRGLAGEVLIYDNDTHQLSSQIAAILNKHTDNKICFFANNDQTMQDMLEVLSAQQLEQVGLCGFANERWAKYIAQGVTCLDQDAVEMGRLAARKLIARAYDDYSGDFELEEVPARLCIFNSTARR